MCIKGINISLNKLIQAKGLKRKTRNFYLQQPIDVGSTLRVSKWESTVKAPRLLHFLASPTVLMPLLLVACFRGSPPR